MKLTLSSEPKERTHTDPSGIVWRYKVRPARSSAVFEAMRTVGIKELGSDDEPGMLLVNELLAFSCVTAIVSAEYEGEPVGVDVDGDEKPATDPSVLRLVLESVASLTQHAGNEAALLGQRVRGEQGNSPTAPVSQPNTPTLKAISEAGM